MIHMNGFLFYIIIDKNVILRFSDFMITLLKTCTVGRYYVFLRFPCKETEVQVGLLTSLSD